MRTGIVTILASVFLAVPTFSETNHSKGVFDLTLVVQDKNWKEDLNNGKNLEESGILIGLAASGHTSLLSTRAFHYLGMVYGGTIDYDGYIIDLSGNMTPYKSETSYGGLLGEFDVSWNMLDADDMQARPFVGAGSRFWLRQLDDGGIYGYDEYWLTIYARAGLIISFQPGPDTTWYASGALILPVYNYEWVLNVPFAPDDQIELKPRKRTGYRLESGIRHGRFTAALFHEALDFGQSPPDKSGVFYQPASEMRLTGIRAGISF
ncbi:MAG TPA: hypothetical protein PJ991_02735 [Kiritimatiellia bacterium]|nr:hypothetical protein [Kiritimatiellia bacterium]